MRRPFIIGRPAPTVLVSPEAALGKTLVSQWIFRLRELPIPLDSRFFTRLRWSANGLKDLPPMLQKQMAAYTGRKRIYTKIRQAVGELQNIPEKRIDDSLEEFAEDHAWFVGPQLKLCLQAFITSRISNDDSLKSYARSLKKFQNFFGLSNEAMKVSLIFLMNIKAM